MEKDIILNNKHARVFNSILKDIGVCTEYKTIVVENYFIEKSIHYLTGKDMTIKDVVQDAVKKNISLEYADLTQAYLTKSKLKGADLEKVRLIGAFLMNTDLTYSNLKGSFLREADLQESDLTNSDLRGAYLINTDFSYSILDNVKVNELTFINKNTYNTIPCKYKHIFNVCNFVD